MPWPVSWWFFGLSLVPTFWFAIFWHEAGHAAAARCLGIPVYAWGLGIRKPWFSIRIGTTSFYIARPLSLGLTHYHQASFERIPRTDFLIFLAGPIATLLGFLAGLISWFLGIHSDLLLAWTLNNAFFVAFSFIPIQLRSDGLTLSTDAHQLLDFLSYGPQAPEQSIGPVLSNLRQFIALFEQIGQAAAAARYRALASLVNAWLHDIPAALEELERAEAVSWDSLPGAQLELAFVKATIAVASKSPTARDQLELAREKTEPGTMLRFLTDCLREAWRLDQGADVSAALVNLRKEAVLARRQDWLTRVDILFFEARNEEDVAVHCWHRRPNDWPSAVVTTWRLVSLQRRGSPSLRLPNKSTRRIRGRLTLSAQPALCVKPSRLRPKMYRSLWIAQRSNGRQFRNVLEPPSYTALPAAFFC